MSKNCFASSNNIRFGTTNQSATSLRQKLCQNTTCKGGKFFAKTFPLTHTIHAALVLHHNRTRRNKQPERQHGQGTTLAKQGNGNLFAREVIFLGCLFRNRKTEKFSPSLKAWEGCRKRVYFWVEWISLNVFAWDWKRVWETLHSLIESSS